MRNTSNQNHNMLTLDPIVKPSRNVWDGENEEGEEVSIGEISKPRQHHPRSRVRSVFINAAGLFREIREASTSKLSKTNCALEDSWEEKDHHEYEKQIMTSQNHNIKEGDGVTMEDTLTPSSNSLDKEDRRLGATDDNNGSSKCCILNGVSEGNNMNRAELLDQIEPAFLRTTRIKPPGAIDGDESSKSQSQTAASSASISDDETGSNEEKKVLCFWLLHSLRSNLETILRWMLLMSLLIIIGLGWTYSRNR